MKRRTIVHAAVAAPLAGFIHGQVFARAEAQPQPEASRFDALSAIGRALAEAMTASDAADLACLAARDSATLAATNAAHSAAQDRVFALRAALGRYRATTLEGCLYQLAEACQVVGSLADAGRAGADDWVEEEEERAKRCLYSVAAVLEGLTGQRLDPGMGMGDLMPKALNPWREEAKAGE